MSFSTNLRESDVRWINTCSSSWICPGGLWWVRWYSRLPNNLQYNRNGSMGYATRHGVFRINIVPPTYLRWRFTKRSIDGMIQPKSPVPCHRLGVKFNGSLLVSSKYAHRNAWTHHPSQFQFQQVASFDDRGSAEPNWTIRSFAFNPAKNEGEPSTTLLRLRRYRFPRRRTARSPLWHIIIPTLSSPW